MVQKGARTLCEIHSPQTFSAVSVSVTCIHTEMVISCLSSYRCIIHFCTGESYQTLIPELSMGFPAGTAGSGSLISTTTQSDNKNVFATDDACSRQHLTTCTYRTTSQLKVSQTWASSSQMTTQEGSVKFSRTFAGSMMPAAMRSSYLSVAALYPKFKLSLAKTFTKNRLQLAAIYLAKHATVNRRGRQHHTFSTTTLPFTPAFFAISLRG